MDKRLEYLSQYKPLYDFYEQLGEKYLPLTVTIRKQKNNIDILQAEYVNDEYALAVDYICDFSDGMFCGDVFFGTPQKSHENYVFTSIGKHDFSTIIATFLENNNDFFLEHIKKNKEHLDALTKSPRKSSCGGH